MVDLLTADDLSGLLFAPGAETARRIVTCFGVLPNAQPAVIFPRLANLMRSGDWLLLSANLTAGRNYLQEVQAALPLYDNALTRDWLSLLLFDCGFERRDGEIRFTIEACDTHPELLQIVAWFDLRRERCLRLGGEAIQFSSGESLRLFYSHRYTAALVDQMIHQAGLSLQHTWITQHSDEGVFVCTGV